MMMNCCDVTILCSLQSTYLMSLISEQFLPCNLITTLSYPIHIVFVIAWQVKKRNTHTHTHTNTHTHTQIHAHTHKYTHTHTHTQVCVQICSQPKARFSVANITSV